MTVDWICGFQVGKLGHDHCGKVICGKKFQHPTFVIEHIVAVHLGGYGTLEDVAKLVRVEAKLDEVS